MNFLLRINTTALAAAVLAAPLHPSSAAQVQTPPEPTPQQAFEKSLKEFVVSALSLSKRDWYSADRKGLLNDSSTDPKVQDWIGFKGPAIQAPTAPGSDQKEDRPCWLRLYPVGGNNVMMTAEWRFQPGTISAEAALEQVTAMGKTVLQALKEKEVAGVSVGRGLEIEAEPLKEAPEFYHAALVVVGSKHPLQVVGSRAESGTSKDWTFIQIHFEFDK